MADIIEFKPKTAPPAELDKVEEYLALVVVDDHIEFYMKGIESQWEAMRLLHDGMDMVFQIVEEMDDGD